MSNTVSGVYSLKWSWKITFSRTTVHFIDWATTVKLWSTNAMYTQKKELLHSPIWERPQGRSEMTLNKRVGPPGLQKEVSIIESMWRDTEYVLCSKCTWCWPPTSGITGLVLHILSFEKSWVRNRCLSLKHWILPWRKELLSWTSTLSSCPTSGAPGAVCVGVHAVWIGCQRQWDISARGRHKPLRKCQVTKCELQAA